MELYITQCLNMAIKIYKKFKKFIKKKFFLETPDLLFTNKKNKINTKPFNKIVSLGNRNKGKIFYVIKRTPGTGLFSNVLFVLNHLRIAIKKNIYLLWIWKTFLQYTMRERR